MSMEAHRKAEELLFSSSSLHIAIVFAFMDQNSLDQQHRLGESEFLPGLLKAAWMKALTQTLPCMDSPGPTVAVECTSGAVPLAVTLQVCPSPKLGSTIPIHKAASLQVEL